MSKKGSGVQRRKPLKTLEGFALLACGWFLEVWYYVFRFTSDGTDWRIGVVIGVSLTIFLSALTRYRERWDARILFCLILIYSVFCTSSGQDVSLSGRLNEVAIESAATDARVDEKARYLEELDRIAEEQKQIQDTLASVPKDIKERAKWRTTIAAAEARKQQLQENKVRYESLIASMGASAVQPEKISTNTYDRFGAAGDAVRILAQVALSIFIALMAPIGRILMEPEVMPVQEEQKKAIPVAKKDTKKPTNWEPYVKLWLMFSYMQNGNVIINYLDFITEFKRKHKDVEYPEQRFKQVFQAAVWSETIRESDGEFRQVERDKVKAAEKIMRYLGDQNE